MRNLGKLFSAMLLTCLLACSNETSEASAPLILPDDAGIVEVDMQTVERPSGCRENENLSRLIPVLSGGKTHPTGRGEHDAEAGSLEGQRQGPINWWWQLLPVPQIVVPHVNSTAVVRRGDDYRRTRMTVGTITVDHSPRH